jgi:hypothetical protein
VRTKCAGNTCVGLWGYSWGPRELPGVGGPDLGEAGRYSRPRPSPRRLRGLATSVGFAGRRVVTVGLGHLLDDFEDSRRPSSLSPRFRRVPVDGWMWRPTEAETIYRQAPRAKGSANRARSGLAGQPRLAGPGPFRPGSAPDCSPVASRVIPYLCALACEPLTSFHSRFRLESLPCKFRCFLVES